MVKGNETDHRCKNLDCHNLHVRLHIGQNRGKKEVPIPFPSNQYLSSLCHRLFHPAFGSFGILLCDHGTHIRVRVKRIAEFPEVVARGTEAREPHHLAYYIRELAGLWNPYVQDRSRHAVLSGDPSLTNARLALTLGVRTVLANALELDLSSAVERKLAKNAMKYPAETFRGRYFKPEHEPDR